MKAEDIEARIIEITKALEQSMQHHNSLVGRLEEAKYVLEKLQPKCEVESAVVEAL